MYFFEGRLSYCCLILFDFDEIRIFFKWSGCFFNRFVYFICKEFYFILYFTVFLIKYCFCLLVLRIKLFKLGMCFVVFKK